MKPVINPVGRSSDLPDSKRDESRLRGDQAILDLPDVEDIPGQEHIKVAPLGELADITISSADEEGDGLFDDEAPDITADVTKEERKILRDANDTVQSSDESALQRAKLDNVDDDGERLNEDTGFSGRDLDVPGSEEDDDNEDIGEEDEENNSYSLDSEKEDDNNGRD